MRGIVHRETAAEDGVGKHERRRLREKTHFQCGLRVRNGLFFGFRFQRLQSFNNQRRKVMAYIVVFLTAACLGVSAFVLHRTLPKQ
jgi:hypothetical protein